AVSAAFLVSYLVYHFGVQLTVRFTHQGPVRAVYYFILLSHVLLAITVPFFATAAALFGMRAVGWGASRTLTPDERAKYRARHRRLVRWAFPIWLFSDWRSCLWYAVPSVAFSRALR
ncbi:MAG TPA: DUF420 domain-containing protein, partial [Lacipirellulaceae bacterium]|nr:DUF420 domain-containing protein [Lacipirellulaceae bacterium]